VGRLLRLLTLLPEEEVAGIEAAHAAAPEAKQAQRALADAVTGLVRGGSGVQAAQRCAAVLYGGPSPSPAPRAAAATTGWHDSDTLARDASNTGDASEAAAPPLPLLQADLLALASAGDLPAVHIPHEAAPEPATALHAGGPVTGAGKGPPPSWVVEALVRAGLAPSKAEARRLMAAGGVRVDHAKVGGASGVAPGPMRPGRVALLSVGAKRQAVIIAGTPPPPPPPQPPLPPSEAASTAV
jgi:tyrosyl-tRNA synthetase